jgi:hypothetical protein
LSTSVKRGKRKREKAKGEKKNSREIEDVEKVAIHFDIGSIHILKIILFYILSRTIKTRMDTYRHWRCNIERFQ